MVSLGNDFGKSKCFNRPAKHRQARLALGPLQRGRYAYSSVGEPQELCAQRTAATATRAAAASRGRAARTKRTNRALTVTPGCTVRAKQVASYASWATR